MTTMIERVAIAMRQKLGGDWPYTGHAYLMDVARAAIEEMREPTEAMLTAGWKEVDVSGVWSAMIDAALNEKEPS